MNNYFIKLNIFYLRLYLYLICICYVVYKYFYIIRVDYYN